MNINWLSTICDPNDIRPICHKPFNLNMGNNAYAIATDARVLCAIKTANDFRLFENIEGYTEKSRHPAYKTIEELLQQDNAGQLTTLSALREWAGDPVPVCESCKSQGYKPCKDCEDGCKKCDYEGTVFCPDCKGESDPYHNPRYGLINDALINRKLISGPLHHLQAEQVHIVIPNTDREVYFITDNWRIVLMPMRTRYFTEEQLNSYSRFDAWQ